jgi:hypothetical protein
MTAAGVKGLAVAAVVGLGSVIFSDEAATAAAIIGRLNKGISVKRSLSKYFPSRAQYFSQGPDATHVGAIHLNSIEDNIISADKRSRDLLRLAKKPRRPDGGVQNGTRLRHARVT